MAEGWNDRLIDVLAFLQRAFGFHPRVPRPMMELASRSRRALAYLEGPRERLPFKIALRQLRYDWDLLNYEAALDDDALRLQIRVLEMARSLPEAEALIRPELEQAPISRLLWAVIVQAHQDQVRQVEFSFIRELISVTYDGREVMTIPSSLDQPLRGMFRFAEAAGYRRLQSFFFSTEGKVPNEVVFTWMDPDLVSLRLE